MSDNHKVIVFKDIKKEYHHKGQYFKALDSVSIEIEKGDIFGLIGTSGAGKSTLLRMINALERPTSGSVWVNGQDLSSLKARELLKLRKDIGIIFQDFNLLESRSVFDNIAIPLKLSGVKGDELKDRVFKLMEFVGLKDKARSFPSELSGGQQQRVGIARALALNPSILLCDEATSALDPNTTESILDLLSRVNRELNVTIVFVTHTIRVIQKICTRVAVLDGGRLIESGPVLEVFSHPQSDIARTFVQSVIPSAIPEPIRAELLKYTGFYRLIRIWFYAKNATDDVIYQINHGLDVHTNVMFASVTEISGVLLSIITLQITGSFEDYERATAYIRSKNIRYEEVVL